MPEKPFSSYPKASGYVIYAGALAELPNMAIGVASAISAWSLIEAELADIAAEMTHSTRDRFLAAFGAVMNDGARLQMLDALGRQCFAGKELSLF